MHYAVNNQITLALNYLSYILNMILISTQLFSRSKPTFIFVLIGSNNLSIGKLSMLNKYTNIKTDVDCSTFYIYLIN